MRGILEVILQAGWIILKHYGDLIFHWNDRKNKHTERKELFIVVFCSLNTLPHIQCGSSGVIFFLICDRLKPSCNFFTQVPYERKKQLLSLPPKLTHPFSLNFLLSIQASLKVMMQSSWLRSTHLQQLVLIKYSQRRKNKKVLSNSYLYFFQRAFILKQPG